MSSEPTPFEVYCPSCDVSFAVGTRRCIHCGRATTGAKSLPHQHAGFGRAESEDFDSGWDDATSFGALSVENETPPEAAGYSGMEDQLSPFDELESASEQPGPGRSILRSLGSLIWIALLIAFSLSGRTCGE